MKSKIPHPTLSERYGNMLRFLDATAQEHGGLDGKKLVSYWNWGMKPYMSVSSLALIAGVSRHTMEKWLDRLHEEAGIDRPRPKRKA